MTSTNNYLPSFDIFQLNDNNQLLNLNLNEKRTSDISLNLASSVKQKSKDTFDSTLFVTNKEKQQTNAWNKSSNFSNLESLYNPSEEGIKKHRKNGSKSTAENASTLSLHISAFENSTEIVASDPFGDKNGIKSKQSFTLASTFVFQNPFEFPRQQNDKVPNPEISEYSATQRLINPNEATTNNQQNDRLRSAAVAANIQIEQLFSRRVKKPNFDSDWNGENDIGEAVNRWTFKRLLSQKFKPTLFMYEMKGDARLFNMKNENRANCLTSGCNFLWRYVDNFLLDDPLSHHIDNCFPTPIETIQKEQFDRTFLVGLNGKSTTCNDEFKRYCDSFQEAFDVPFEKKDKKALKQRINAAILRKAVPTEVVVNENENVDQVQFGTEEEMDGENNKDQREELKVASDEIDESEATEKLENTPGEEDVEKDLEAKSQDFDDVASGGDGIVAAKEMQENVHKEPPKDVVKEAANIVSKDVQEVGEKEVGKIGVTEGSAKNVAKTVQDIGSRDAEKKGVKQVTEVYGEYASFEEMEAAFWGNPMSKLERKRRFAPLSPPHHKKVQKPSALLLPQHRKNYQNIQNENDVNRVPPNRARPVPAQLSSRRVLPPQEPASSILRPNRPRQSEAQASSSRRPPPPQMPPAAIRSQTRRPYNDDDDIKLPEFGRDASPDFWDN